MTIPVPFYAGTRPTAAQLNEIQPLQAIKSAGQSVTSSTTLVSDTALAIALPVANAQYIFRAMCYYYKGGTLGASDLKLVWAIPSGASLVYMINGVGTGGSWFDGGGFAGGGGAQAFGTQGTSTQCGVLFCGSLIVGSTTGTLQLEWAQNTSSGTATTVEAGSLASLTRVS